MYKYYLRLNNDNYIIHAFSDAFEQPKENDILFKESPERIFILNITNKDGYKYKYENGEIIEIPKQELIETYHNNLNNRKAVFMNSGGPDCLASVILSKDKYELHSLYINVGLPCHNRIQPVIKRIAEKYCVSHYEMKVEGNWGMKDRKYWDEPFFPNAPETHPHQINVPSQFMIYHSLAYLYTAQNGIRKVVSGCKKEVRGKQQAELLRMAQIMIRMGHTLEFDFPTYDLNDTEISKIIQTEEELKDYTVSCNHEIPCGICAKCWRKREHLKLKEEVYV